MKIINLLPQEEQQQLRYDFIYHQLRNFWIIVIVTLIVFIGLGFGVKQYLKLKVGDIEREIAVTKVQLESDELKQLQSQVLDLNRTLREIKSIRNQQHQWSEVLLEIANIIPSGAQLNSLSIDRKTGEVTILGKAKDRQTVLDIWSEIKKSYLFYDVNFPLPNLENPVDSNFTYKFYVYKDKIKHDAKN